MFEHTPTESALIRKLLALKAAAGSHSPSVMTIRERLAELRIDVDACFLSNPYATALFLRKLQADLLDTGKIRDVLEFYPAQNAVIAERLAKFLQIRAEQLFIGNGAIEIIQALMHRYAGNKILVNVPTFSSYYEFAPAGSDVVLHQLRKEDDYRLDVPRFLARVNEEKPSTVVLINPNNPDGNYLPLEELHAIVAQLQQVELVIVDESFIHFAYEDPTFAMRSAVGLLDDFDNVAVVKSMSKDFGIAGIRAGYVAMREDRVRGLLDNGYLWNVNGLAEYFFAEYVDPDFQQAYERVRVRYIAESQEFFDALAQLPGLRVVPSMANFALIEILDGPTADEFAFHMLVRHGVYTRTCSDKVGLEGEYIRVASRSRDENRAIVAAMEATLQAWRPQVAIRAAS